MEPSAQLESARKLQDRELRLLGLYRFRIPEDGNCLFRAVAAQLGLEQESAHPKLRKEAFKWMMEHAEELLAYGLVDSFDEITESSKIGVWPGQAALVALANVKNLNIAIIQGGDRGHIDIQHISPFNDEKTDAELRSIQLVYLYSGHYDTAINEKNKVNPAYDTWCKDKERKCNVDELIARDIALEEVEMNSNVNPLKVNSKKQREISGNTLYDEKSEENSNVTGPASDLNTASSNSTFSSPRSPKLKEDSRGCIEKISTDISTGNREAEENVISFKGNARTDFEYTHLTQDADYHSSMTNGCYGLGGTHDSSRLFNVGRQQPSPTSYRTTPELMKQSVSYRTSLYSNNLPCDNSLDIEPLYDNLNSHQTVIKKLANNETHQILFRKCLEERDKSCPHQTEIKRKTAIVHSHSVDNDLQPHYCFTNASKDLDSMSSVLNLSKMQVYDDNNLSANARYLTERVVGSNNLCSLGNKNAEINLIPAERETRANNKSNLSNNLDENKSKDKDKYQMVKNSSCDREVVINNHHNKFAGTHDDIYDRVALPYGHQKSLSYNNPNKSVYHNAAEHSAYSVEKYGSEPLHAYPPQVFKDRTSSSDLESRYSEGVRCNNYDTSIAIKQHRSNYDDFSSIPHDHRNMICNPNLYKFNNDHFYNLPPAKLHDNYDVKLTFNTQDHLSSTNNVLSSPYENEYFPETVINSQSAKGKVSNQLPVTNANKSSDYNKQGYSTKTSNNYGLDIDSQDSRTKVRRYLPMVPDQKNCTRNYNINKHVDSSKDISNNYDNDNAKTAVRRPSSAYRSHTVSQSAAVNIYPRRNSITSGQQSQPGNWRVPKEYQPKRQPWK